MQLSWFALRTTIALSLLLVLFLSQRFWYRSLWRWSSSWGTKLLRIGIRALYVIGLLLIIVSLVDALRNGRGSIIPRGTFLNVVAGLWFFIEWCMLRIKVNLSATRAMPGSRSHTMSCGALVAAGLNSPRIASGAFGFMSKVST